MRTHYKILAILILCTSFSKTVALEEALLQNLLRNIRKSNVQTVERIVNSNEKNFTASDARQIHEALQNRIYPQNHCQQFGYEKSDFIFSISALTLSGLFGIALRQGLLQKKAILNQGATIIKKKSVKITLSTITTFIDNSLSRIFDLVTQGVAYTCITAAIVGIPATISLYTYKKFQKFYHSYCIRKHHATTHFIQQKFPHLG